MISVSINDIDLQNTQHSISCLRNGHRCIDTLWCGLHTLVNANLLNLTFIINHIISIHYLSAISNWKQFSIIHMITTIYFLIIN